MGAGRSVPRRGHDEQRERPSGGRKVGCWGRSSGTMSSSSPQYRSQTQSQVETTVYDGGIYYGEPFRAEEAFSGSISPSLVAAELKLRQFTYHDLMRATGNFRPENFLGMGGFGRVHKGWIQQNGTAAARPGTGLPVAVKTLSCDGLQGHDEWVAEIHYLRNLRHPHLVKLIGFCMEGDQRQLAYEFMSHGSLENHLFMSRTPLPWSVRVKILLGAAKGLAFLHEEAEVPVIFRDFKTSNILLDEDFNAKLSDFGLARDGPVGERTHVSTRVLGTYGYAAPEYVMTGHLTSMSDVYSFGVVVLEVLTGRKAMEKSLPNGEQNLVDWGRRNAKDRERFHRLIDPSLGSRFSISGGQMLARVAYGCTNRDPKSRPLMSNVVQTLETALKLQDMATDTGLYRTMQMERASASASASANANAGGGTQPPSPKPRPSPIPSPSPRRSISSSSSSPYAPYPYGGGHA